ncbi:MAG: UbiA family prenyltransferase [Desulfobacteraceae bacterium]|nr:UbiA family prenyltransferase [Desulfobacteraceae bacterium]
MIQFYRNMLAILEKQPNSLVFSLFLVSFVSGIRLIGEWLILDGQKYFAYGGLPHHFGFYLAMFVINVNNMSLLLKRPWSRYYGIVGIGMLLGVLPLFIDAPIIDVATQRYHYVQGFHPFLFSDSLPIGESITLWIWILSFSFYIYMASSSCMKALRGAILTYCTIQFAGWISTICKGLIYDYFQIKLPGDHYWTMWWLLIAFGIAVAANWDQFRSVFHRIHHTFIWGIFVLLGAKLVGFVDTTTLSRAFIMSMSFLFVMVVNDYFDKDTDRVNGRESPITWEMVLFTIYCHMVLVLTAGDADFVLGVIAFLCFILGMAYNSSAVFRLKNNFVLGSLVEGTGAFLCLLAGGTQFGPPLSRWFLPLILVFGAGFMLASNMKDYKDFKGDFDCNITTLYVYLYEKGWKLGRTNLLVSITLALMLMVPCLMMYLLQVPAGLILIACILAVIPYFMMTRITTPEAAVRYSLWGIIGYFLFMVRVIPRLPV